MNTPLVRAAMRNLVHLAAVARKPAASFLRKFQQRSFEAPPRIFLLALLLSTASLEGQSIPPERPRARPPSELTGWADWERAAEIFSRVKVPPAPPLDPEEAMKTFRVAPGFRLELVAAEPMVVNPIFFEFDPDGRIWAIEYRGYMRDLEGSDEGEPICKVVVLEDLDEDGRADRSTVFLDNLVMPRSLAFVEGGVLIAEPPHLWYCRDTDGDLRCDTKTEVGRYGVPGNPQHTANGLVYGIDNWLHSADWERRHAFREGRLIEEPALYRGQFGVSFDEFGRYVTCRESSPAEMDFIPEEYLRRNPALVRTLQRGGDRARFGIAVPIGREANECFPIRPTPAITLGALELRSDGTLRTYTIVAGTGVYLGDQFPEDAYGNIFVPEAGGHLIGRLRVTGGIEPRASRYYPDGQEILASTDERFRPMSIRTGPDGALYFADMYRGIIEHVIFMAPYIADQIKERNLATGLDMGRIYRLVSTEKPIRRRNPRLSTASTAELVNHLNHPNGWWRITSQRLLVERRDPAAAPLLKELVSTGTNPVGRMHALWTLHGLGKLDWETAFPLTESVAELSDRHAVLRATAIRLCERLLNDSSGGSVEQAALFSRLSSVLQDPRTSPFVRLQAVLSLGSIKTPAAGRILAQVLSRADSPLFRTAALSGLAGRETSFLEELMTHPGWGESSEARIRFLRELAQVRFHGGEPEAISQLFTTAFDRTGSLLWQRAALVEGLLQAAPADLHARQPIRLSAEPPLIPALLKSPDSEEREQGRRLFELFTWPGRPAVAGALPGVEPLSPADEARFAEGLELYTQLCAPCHQPHGGGLPNVAPPLNGSEWVAGPAERLVRIVLHGLFGPLEVGGQRWNHHMPGFAETGLMNDESVAGLLTYVRRAWENTAAPVDPSLVAQVRAATEGRQLPWTASELAGVAAAAEADGEILRPDPSGEILLPASKAVCYGERLAYRPSLDIVAPWRRENDVATWTVEIPAACEYEVYITLAADNASAGDSFHVETESGRATGTVAATGGYDRFEEQRVGKVLLREGVNRILLRPAGKLRAELADVRRLRLIPVRE